MECTWKGVNFYVVYSTKQHTTFLLTASSNDSDPIKTSPLIKYQNKINRLTPKATTQSAHSFGSVWCLASAEASAVRSALKKEILQVSDAKSSFKTQPFRDVSFRHSLANGYYYKKLFVSANLKWSALILFILVRHTSKLNYRTIVNTVQSDSICRYLLPLQTEINGRGNPLRSPRNTLYPQKSALLRRQWRSLGWYSSLAD
jgi:hypothetical protein